MSQLKVYGWSTMRGHTQAREIVAAHSSAEVARLAGYKRVSQLFQFSQTWNQPEIAQAMSKPGVVFWHPLDERPPIWQRQTPLPPFANHDSI